MVKRVEWKGLLSAYWTGFKSPEQLSRPDMAEIETLEDTVVVPLGQPKQQLKSKVNSISTFILLLVIKVGQVIDD